MFTELISVQIVYKFAKRRKDKKMNIRQKVGLGIMAPLFTLAVGHTVLNKINSQKETAKTEVIPDITNQLEMHDKNATSVFKAEQNLLKEIQKNAIPFNEYSKNVVKSLEQSNFSYSPKEAQEILENSVECGD